MTPRKTGRDPMGDRASGEATGNRAAGVQSFARLLDSAFRIPGTKVRFGLDPIIGLVPGVGDLAGAVLSGFIILRSARLGAPRSVLARMVMNVAIDTVVGSVPILGDLFDVVWRSNLRNAKLLERHLARPEHTRRASRWLVAVVAGALVLLAAGMLALALFTVHVLLQLAHRP